jgi:hypothetical protein
VKPKARAVLLPTNPGEDLLQLLHSLNITCIYEDGNSFVRREP